MTASEMAEKLNGIADGDGWKACCPAHKDNDPSLSIKAGDNGMVLLYCHAGCQYEDILKAIGLSKQDVNPRPVQVAQYDYRDVAGSVVYQKIRYVPKDFRLRYQDHAGNWVWNLNGVTKVLYRLPELMVAIKNQETVFLVEGEKDADTLAGIGLCATCNVEGSVNQDKNGTLKKWLKRYTESLTDANLVIIADKDDKGRMHAALLNRELSPVARTIKVMEMPDGNNGQTIKDVSDWMAAGGDKEAFLGLVDQAGVWEGPDINQPLQGRPLPPVDQSPIEAAKQGQPFAMTDLGNAERFVFWHGDKVRWDLAHNRWRTWDGTRWALDGMSAESLAHETARKIRDEASAAPSTGNGGRNLPQELFSWALKTEARDRLNAMLSVAKARPGIAVRAGIWDNDPWLLNVMNGTVDLQTGNIKPHDPADMITKRVPVEYHPECIDERWERFLRDAVQGDAEQIEFLQRAAGYTLTGRVDEEALIFIYGPKFSGKTTFLEAIKSIAGEYSHTINPDLLTQNSQKGDAGRASPELAALAGVRLAAGSEMQKGRKFAEAFVKSLTGGERITARPLYGSPFEFMPEFKIWIALNNCPEVSSDDDAIWRRIIRIGFEHTVPKNQRDKSLKLYLCNPDGGAPAVLAWAVKGCRMWMQNPEGLALPKAVQVSTDAYRLENDPVAAFFTDCLCFTDPDVWTQWSDIQRAYTGYAEEQGIRDRSRLTTKVIQDGLRDRGCEPRQRHSGRGWLGVQVKANDPIDPDKSPKRPAVPLHPPISNTFSSDSLREKGFGKSTPLVGRRDGQEITQPSPTADDSQIREAQSNDVAGLSNPESMPENSEEKPAQSPETVADPESNRTEAETSDAQGQNKRPAVPLHPPISNTFSSDSLREERFGKIPLLVGRRDGQEISTPKHDTHDTHDACLDQPLYGNPLQSPIQHGDMTDMPDMEDQPTLQEPTTGNATDTANTLNTFNWN